MKTKLKKWIKKNSASKLAAMLGYKSSSTIYNWIKRGIPNYQLKNLKDILCKQAKK